MEGVPLEQRRKPCLGRELVKETRRKSKGGSVVASPVRVLVLGGPLQVPRGPSQYRGRLRRESVVRLINIGKVRRKGGRLTGVEMPPERGVVLLFS